MYTFLLSEFKRLSKFELERELPQTTDQSKVVNLMSRLWYRVSRVSRWAWTRMVRPPAYFSSLTGPDEQFFRKMETLISADTGKNIEPRPLI